MPHNTAAYLQFVAGLAFLAIGLAPVCCHPPTTGEVKTGITITSDVCKEIDSFSDSGVVESICATAAEVDAIVKLLGREPTPPELIHGVVMMRHARMMKHGEAL